MIQLKNIHKRYQMGENVVDALRGVSLDIARGDFMSIVGASGSGKTTLMNIIGCLDIPTSGHYILEDEDVSNFGRDRLALLRNTKIGFVFQNFNLLGRLTALENVEMPLIFRGEDKWVRREKAAIALERVGLESRMMHKPNQLSGGQQQRVAIARAIVGEPSVLLADEPTGNLDTASGQDILRLLTSLNNGGTTVVLITHDPRIAAFSRRSIVLSDGRIISNRID
ncbi:MAG: ABC transporter ATP-binding protein [Eubacteriales bacterium]